MAMTRKQLLITTLAQVQKLQSDYPDDPALMSIVIQLQFLIELSAKQRSDANRLQDINIGLLAVREVEPLDLDTAELLYKVDDEVDRMKLEYPHT